MSVRGYVSRIVYTKRCTESTITVRERDNFPICKLGDEMSDLIFDIGWDFTNDDGVGEVLITADTWKDAWVDEEERMIKSYNKYRKEHEMIEKELEADWECTIELL